MGGGFSSPLECPRSSFVQSANAGAGPGAPLGIRLASGRVASAPDYAGTSAAGRTGVVELVKEPPPEFPPPQFRELKRYTHHELLESTIIDADNAYGNVEGTVWTRVKGWLTTRDSASFTFEVAPGQSLPTLVTKLVISCSIWDASPRHMRLDAQDADGSWTPVHRFMRHHRIAVTQGIHDTTVDRAFETFWFLGCPHADAGRVETQESHPLLSRWFSGGKRPDGDASAREVHPLLPRGSVLSQPDVHAQSRYWRFVIEDNGAVMCHTAENSCSPRRRFPATRSAVWAALLIVRVCCVCLFVCFFGGSKHRCSAEHRYRWRSLLPCACTCHSQKKGLQLVLGC